jgi:hypothetical protein
VTAPTDATAAGPGAGAPGGPVAAPPGPTLRVLGPATPEDVAAVVAVLAAAAGDSGSAPPERPSTWAAHDVAMRGPLPHGPGAWHTTYRR